MLLVAGDGRRIAVEQQDQVDIARIVEFVGAQFAHAQYRQCRGVGIAFQGKLAITLDLQQNPVDQRLQASVGECAQRSGDALERPDPGDVGNGDRQGKLPFLTAQRGGDLGRSLAGPSGRRRRIQRRHEVRSDSVRAASPQIGHKFRVL